MNFVRVNIMSSFTFDTSEGSLELRCSFDSQLLHITCWSVLGQNAEPPSSWGPWMAVDYNTNFPMGSIKYFKMHEKTPILSYPTFSEDKDFSWDILHSDIAIYHPDLNLQHLMCIWVLSMLNQAFMCKVKTGVEEHVSSSCRKTCTVLVKQMCGTDHFNYLLQDLVEFYPVQQLFRWHTWIWSTHQRLVQLNHSTAIVH